MPERRQYAADVYWRAISVSRPTARVAELIFTQTKPGRAKTKRLYLRWDAEQVGNIRLVSAPAAQEKTSAGVTAP
jgi:hypothetical protein